MARAPRLNRSFTVDRWQDAALRDLADKMEASQSELVREALTAWLPRPVPAKTSPNLATSS